MLLRFGLCLFLFVFLGCGGCGKTPPVSIKPGEEETESKKQEIKSAKLVLNLKEGERFPMVKTVIKKLRQKGDDGAESTETLKFWLAITVVKIQPDGNKLFSVRYDRVSFDRKVGESHIEYDSDKHGSQIPAAARVYAGLVDNGFGFWLGADNKMKKPVRFDEFLATCTRHLPKKQRAGVFKALRDSTINAGVASFIDDSIGLLPYGDAKREFRVKIGEEWSTQRLSGGAIPTRVSTTYTLAKIRQELIDVSIKGDIQPVPQPVGKTVVGRLVKGTTVGDCSIERRSGLPRRLSVHQTMHLAIKTADGKEVSQEKRVATTIETYTSPNKKPVRVGEKPSR